MEEKAMTHLRRIAQLVRDLRELNVIQERDKIEYGCIDVHQITITTGIDDDKEEPAIQMRYGMIYHAFLREFSPEERGQQDYDCNKVMFVIRELS